MKSASISTRLEHVPARAGERPFSRLLLLLLGGSLLVHLAVVLVFIHQPIALDDMFQYDMLARSLEKGNGFRWYSQADVAILRPYYAQFLDIDHLPFPEQGLTTAFRAPGYPFFLALLYALVPESGRFILARLAQAGLAAALAPLAALLGRRAGFSQKVSALAGIGISAYPILLFYPVGLASENLYILLGLSSLVALLSTTERASWGRVIGAGVLCGLTMFTRSIFAVFVLLAGAWLTHYHPSHKKAGALFWLIAFGLCLPWSIRNSLIMRQPAFVENSAGYNLFIGYHPQGDGGFVSRIAILPLNILDDGQRDRWCRQQALQFIQANPPEALRRIAARLVKFIGPEDREFFYFYSNDLVGAISQPWLALLYSLLVVPWAATLLLGIGGLWQARRQPASRLVLLLLLGYGLPHLLIIAEPRFHLAWVPVLMPFAAYGWTQAGKIWRKPLFRKERLLLAALLLATLSIFVIALLTNLPTLTAIMKTGGNTLHFSY